MLPLTNKLYYEAHITNFKPYDDQKKELFE